MGNQASNRGVKVKQGTPQDKDKHINGSSPSREEDGLIQFDARKWTEIPSFVFCDVVKDKDKDQPEPIDEGFEMTKERAVVVHSLILNFNRLSSIDKRIASNFPNLTELSLAANRIDTIPPEIFKGCLQLKYLHLGVNKITSIPDEIEFCSHLKDLNIASNRLTTLPSGISNLNELTHLTLTSNRLTECPSHLPSSLQVLLLNSNNLTSFPSDLIPQLSSTLQELDLSENNITTLPSTLTRLSRLQRLRLRCNELSTIIDARDNHPQQQEGEEEVWPQLYQLDVSYNNLEAFPSGLLRLSSLQSLAIHGNPLNLSEDKREWAIKDREEYEMMEKKCRTIEAANENIPDEILPSLYLGSIESAKNKHLLKKLGITHILCVCPFKRFYPMHFEYCKLVLDDAKSDKFMSQLPSCLDFINSALNNTDTPCKVLIHCRRGVSRSAAVTIAFVMQHEGKDFNEALEHVASRRSCIHPKECFREQLREWDYTLYKK